MLIGVYDTVYLICVLVLNREERSSTLRNYRIQNGRFERRRYS